MKRPIFLLLAALLSLGLLLPRPATAEPKLITECQAVEAPGSYLVANNLESSGDCLVILADFVSIDLGGFSLTGHKPQRAGPWAGVTDQGSDRLGITVRNGTLRNFNIGIDLSKTVGARVEAVHVVIDSGIGADGIRVGPGSVVTGNFVRGGSNAGIFALEGSIVTGNAVRNQGVVGIHALHGSIVSGNTLVENALGMHVESSGTVTGNAAYKNKDGIEVLCPSTVLGNTAVSYGENLRLLPGWPGAPPCHTGHNAAPAPAP
ncbi:MAG: hypothetical protein HY703_06220 [Gemmatimonadetes bacterium]|nr:hypothetical protein [Gemmatimonadota bacterium]